MEQKGEGDDEEEGQQKEAMSALDLVRAPPSVLHPIHTSLFVPMYTQAVPVSVHARLTALTTRHTNLVPLVPTATGGRRGAPPHNPHGRVPASAGRASQSHL